MHFGKPYISGPEYGGDTVAARTHAVVFRLGRVSRYPSDFRTDRRHR
jgi:hypothetical protein